MLQPVVGDERLSQMANTERRVRRALAQRMAPAPKPQSGRRQQPRKRQQRTAEPAVAAVKRRRPSPTYPEPTMTRHEFLAGLHRQLQPRTYLEIGVSDGRSLALSRARSIGVDPAFNVKAPIACDVRLVRATSDDFFASPDAVAHFDAMPVDLAFIDGLHRAEFAYRDFANVEPLCSPASVVVLDDMLPRSDEEAARVQIRGAWAGDVFKVAEILRLRRPDLTVVPVNTEPTGVVVVMGLDPASTVLDDIYDEVLAQLQAPDPQRVPEHVINRDGAADARALVESPVWGRLRQLRRSRDRARVADALTDLSAVRAG